MKVREEKGRRRGRTLGSYRYEEPRGRTMVSSGLKKKNRKRKSKGACCVGDVDQGKGNKKGRYLRYRALGDRLTAAYAICNNSDINSQSEL